MKRRDFIFSLGGAAVAWPLAARAQQTPPMIGFLGPASASSMSAWTAAFVQRLRELGWIEGRTIRIEYRWGDGRADRLPEIAAEFVRLKVDVIVTTGTPVPVFKEATSTIPIVFTIASDPIGGGLVGSLSRPGGNVTGLSQLAADLGGKRLELLREVIPDLRRLATLSNAGNAATASEMIQVSEAARTLGLELVNSEIRRSEDITPAIESLKGRADALYACADALISANAARINALALAARLPTMFYAREYLEGGGFMSYGPNVPDLFRRSADFVDKILRGTKPSDIPVEQPTRFELIVNLKTAKALGLALSPTLLATADEVIE